MSDHVSESEILRAIQLRLGCRDDLLLMRRNVGLARSPQTGRTVRFGTVGEADLQGVLRVRCACGRIHGLPVALEVKTATGRQSDEQRAWQAAWERRGGLYRVVRSADEAWSVVEEAVRA